MLTLAGALLPAARTYRCTAPVFGTRRQFRQRANRRSSRQSGLQCAALFNFGKSAQAEKKYANEYTREDYKEGDVEDYFNYMGMLAAEGNYDRLEKMLGTGTPPVDLLLLMAASEDDAPKVAEVLRAGADLEVKDINGKTAKELASSEAVLELLNDRQKAFTF